LLIGKAVAKRLARDGAKVAVNCVSTVDKAKAVVEDIRKAGGEAVVVPADVSKKADAERLIADTIKAFGQVDILVSNAGIVIDRPFVDSTDEDWTRAIENNLHGFFNVTRAVLPHMIGRKQGRVIATGSCITEVADFGGNCYSVCTASKGGIVAMLRQHWRIIWTNWARTARGARESGGFLSASTSGSPCSARSWARPKHRRPEHDSVERTRTERL